MRSRILLSMIALLLVTQSCCCCAMLGGPQPPYSITPSDEAFERLIERLDQATSGPEGTFTITVTDEEITSLVAHRFAALEQEGQPSPIRDPQVYFRNGRIEAYATLEFSEALALPCMLAMTITIEDGAPVVTVEEVVVGPLSVPAALVQQLTETIGQQIAAALSGERPGFVIVSVQIGDGQMTITGQTAPQ